MEFGRGVMDNVMYRVFYLVVGRLGVLVSGLSEGLGREKKLHER